MSGREEEREAAMLVAYVTFRMTLAGLTGLLPHQFSCCPRGHGISLSLCLSLSLPLFHSLQCPVPGNVRSSTWPNTPRASDWPLKAGNPPPAPQPERLCLETEAALLPPQTTAAATL